MRAAALSILMRDMGDTFVACEVFAFFSIGIVHRRLVVTLANARAFRQHVL